MQTSIRRYRSPLLRVALAGLLGTLAACSDSATPGRSDPRQRADDPPAAAGPFEPTLEAIQENVFTPVCAECHAGALASGGLSLEDARASYDGLVDADSSQVGTLKLVEPGHPDDSYLIHKLEGTQQSGVRMPSNQPPLDQQTVDVIRQWITDGALPPGASPPAQRR